jgi:hypothetical protein
MRRLQVNSPTQAQFLERSSNFKAQTRAVISPQSASMSARPVVCKRALLQGDLLLIGKNGIYGAGITTKTSKVAKCFEPRLPWELEIANSLEAISKFPADADAL